MRLMLILLALLSTMHTAHGAACAYPNASGSMPNGNTASEAEMLAAMNSFKQYNATVNAYLQCLEAETTDRIRDAGGATSAIVQIKTMQSKKHNAAVAELKAVTEKFNEQVRVFKARK